MRFDDDPRLRAVNMAFYENSFVTGTANRNRLRVRYFFRAEDGHLLADVSSGADAMGPPGFVHGGAMAALLDDAMGVMAWFNKHPVVTANLNVDYKQSLPLGIDTVLETWIERVEGKKVYTYGELRSDKAIHTCARGLFVRLPLESFGEYLEPIRRQYGL